jgi:hypothetical protein
MVVAQLPRKKAAVSTATGAFELLVDISWKDWLTAALASHDLPRQAPFENEMQI